MANKEALLRFQSRIAQRLQQVQTAGVGASWLGVEAAGAHLLIPLSHAGEIHAWSAPMRVPYTQPWFMGVVNLRGVLTGAIDLTHLITGKPLPVAIGDAEQQRRLVTFNPALEINAALLVERLAGLRAMDSFINSEKAPAGSPAFFAHRYADAQGHVWQEINLQALAQQPEFLSISASV